jgi:hypothetical protein
MDWKKAPENRKYPLADRKKVMPEVKLLKREDIITVQMMFTSYSSGVQMIIQMVFTTFKCLAP